MLIHWFTVATLAASVGSASKSFLPLHVSYSNVDGHSYSPDLELLEEVFEALGVLQDKYFQPWRGEWPSAIDWTAAVTGSQVSGALTTLTKSLGLVHLEGGEDYKLKENLITLYFSQVVGSYFGQNALAIRHQAFDDILWVVLGWLDTTQFIDLHAASYSQTGTPQTNPSEGIPEILQNQTWHGSIWVPALAHRARVFWELASTGWDDILCGGGMTWNPRLEPYKNAITNELFIAASISMYLYFPGDSNACPYASGTDSTSANPDTSEEVAADWQRNDVRYLYAAVNGYEWLMNSNMTNTQGLFTDGFHISGFYNRSNPNTKCDVRNEMVYTYNQGVILTGQIGLFKASGHVRYLDDGHALIQNVIAATGYDLKSDRPVDDLSKLPPGALPRWRGLGRAGVLEDLCDPRGDCSQNGHTFKGIFFHHLSAFCGSLAQPSRGLFSSSPPTDGWRFAEVRRAHDHACAAYLGWVRHNARAALLTRDSEGRFGTWWTAGLLGLAASGVATAAVEDAGAQPDGAVDYRNYGVPGDDPLWVPPGGKSSARSSTPVGEAPSEQYPLRRPAEGGACPDSAAAASSGAGDNAGLGDPNSRGRGRTVETQGGGLAVLRCWWEISRLGAGS